MENPWPDEHIQLEYFTPEEVVKVGGELTRKLTAEARKEGYLDSPDGLYTLICVRCSFQAKGDFQHLRTDWHRDNAEKAWIWVDGPTPTEVRSGPVPTKQFVEYTGQEHRCPPQTEDGWRYFYRIMWCKRKPRNRKVK